MTTLNRTMNCTNVGVSYAWHHLDSDAKNKYIFHEIWLLFLSKQLYCFISKSPGGNNKFHFKNSNEISYWSVICQNCKNLET